MSLRELWFVSPRQVELRTGRAMPLAPGCVRAHALASGISQGTELLLYRGEGPTPFDPSLDAPGTPTFPRRYGYAWVGEVLESADFGPRVGSRVFALAPHGDEHCLPVTQLRALPSALPPARAVLAANLETAVNVVWDAEVTLGDEVTVLGGGVVGLLIGFVATRAGARVTLLEPSPRRREAAKALGIGYAQLPDEAEPSSADIVIEATGDPSVLASALRLVRDEGVVTVASFYGERVAPLALGVDFHRRRLTLRSSQVSRLPRSRAGGWSFERRFSLVVELLHDFALDALLDPVVPFGDAPATYARLAAAPGDALQTVFGYRR